MNKLALIILDGWGLGDGSKSDAVFHAETPCMDRLMATCPNSELLACGEAVGLPAGQMGNSEVGHLNIGAGRVVYQELSRINHAISDQSFFSNQTLIDAFDFAIENKRKIHLLGLVSDGGVHSSIDHLMALIKLSQQKKASQVFIHAITDGRDCDPKSAMIHIDKLAPLLNEQVQLASIIGRYYAMDRDQRWDRIESAYNLLVHGAGQVHRNAEEAINESYSKGIHDEFIKPVLLSEKGLIENGDVVISFNFRTDRPREITQVLTQSSIVGFEMKPLDLYFVTMTNYDDTFKNIHVAFQKENLNQTLGETISKAGLSQVRIAETEKYPHVTYFFNGGREDPFPRETRLMVNSPKVATYDLRPEMSAEEVKNVLIEYALEHKPDFICLNFANPDMVGHTGVYDSIIRAVEVVDSALDQIIENLSSEGYSFIIIADHGNADFALNEDGSPNTAHSLNKVPCVYIGKKCLTLADGILADVAPTILELMGLSIPHVMTGQSLIKKGA